MVKITIVQTIQWIYNVFGTNVPKFFKSERGFATMKETYILEINKYLKQCNDIPLLDLILKLLIKSN
jgi:hypothetical protein